MSSIESEERAAADSSAAAIHRRYRRDAAFRAPEWNATLDLLLGHRSIRAFRDRALPAGTLELLIAAAQSAPTSSNLQSWSVVVVSDPQARASIAEWSGNQKHVVEAPLFLVFLADLARAERVAAAAGGEATTLDLIEPVVVGIVDAALAAQNAVVAAESIGLGTVYIGALRNRIEDVAALLGLPPRVVPVFGLAVGHPDPSVASGVKPRLSQRVVLHHDHYAPPADEAALVADYDAALKAFQVEQNLPPVDWSYLSSKRVTDLASLAGRQRLRAALEKLGLPLR
jgi:nitroreductase